MADEEKKIIVDDDWKAQAQAEKERLAEEVDKQSSATGDQAAPSFVELINLLVMQVMAGLGLLAGPGGERIPPNLEAAKHMIDMLQMLEDKTRGNLTDEEKKLLDQVLYEMRMRYVQVSSGGGGPTAAPGG